MDMTAEKIRELAASGMTMGEFADYLDSQRKAAGDDKLDSLLAEEQASTVPESGVFMPSKARYMSSVNSIRDIMSAGAVFFLVMDLLVADSKCILEHEKDIGEFFPESIKNISAASKAFIEGIDAIRKEEHLIPMFAHCKSITEALSSEAPMMFMADLLTVPPRLVDAVLRFSPSRRSGILP
ncbi:MAG: hypothetical protein WC455_08895 [Dehalococcoidia bacterium]|jgi:hypothetical protein